MLMYYIMLLIYYYYYYYYYYLHGKQLMIFVILFTCLCHIIQILLQEKLEIDHSGILFCPQS